MDERVDIRASDEVVENTALEIGSGSRADERVDQDPSIRAFCLFSRCACSWIRCS
jgi:hypothetical protein